MIDRRRRHTQAAADGSDATPSTFQLAGSTRPDDPGQAERLAGSIQLEVALYIESISAELREMARAADLEALQYFLEMARLEASIQVERRASQDRV